MITLRFTGWKALAALAGFVVILVSLAAWGGLWGVAGMFLCVPIMVIVMIVCAHFAPTRRLAILLSATGRLDKDVPDPAFRQPALTS